MYISEASDHYFIYRKLLLTEINLNSEINDNNLNRIFIYNCTGMKIIYHFMT